MVLIAGLALSGCAPTRPPDTGLGDAAQALADAREAGAPTYAPLELRSAQDHLNQAREQAGKRHHEESRRLTDESRADSELAELKARLGKLREQVQGATADNERLRQQSAGAGGEASP
jgi:hypothetical protein